MLNFRPEAAPACTADEFVEKFDGYFELTKDLLSQILEELKSQGVSGPEAIMQLQQQYV